jgi:hypothetical protein
MGHLHACSTSFSCICAQVRVIAGTVPQRSTANTTASHDDTQAWTRCHLVHDALEPERNEQAGPHEEFVFRSESLNTVQRWLRLLRRAAPFPLCTSRHETSPRAGIGLIVVRDHLYDDDKEVVVGHLLWQGEFNESPWATPSDPTCSSFSSVSPSW